MTKICCVLVALFTVGDDSARCVPAERKNMVLLAVNRRSDVAVRSKAYVAILPLLTLTEESSVYGKRIIAAFAIPLLGF
jgi:hypothetical protein